MTTPDTLPDDIAALRALVLTAWAERDAARAEKGRLAEERDQLAGQNDRLRHLLRQLQRMQFGRRSEKLDPEQLNLALEDLEQAVAAGEAEQEKSDPALRKARSEKRCAGRRPLPAHLPRVEIVIEPEDTACPCFSIRPWKRKTICRSITWHIQIMSPAGPCFSPGSALRPSQYGIRRMRWNNLRRVLDRR